MASLAPQVTDFSRDVMGRYVCSGFDEALQSTFDGDSPFHYIVLGGGTFGGILASFLMGLDNASDAFGDPFKRYRSRILVLEAGPFLLPEHEQNLPAIGVGVPGPATIAELQPDPSKRTVPAPPRNEVWGVPWHSDDGFNGLAYCLGGRSLFWGGWAPRFLRSEMPVNGAGPVRWPRRVVDDLHADGEALWKDAAHQLGVDDPTDFINGELHTRFRQAVYDAIGQHRIRHLIPLAQLPDYVDVAKQGVLLQAAPPAELLRLDAPYAVQSTTRSGFFPFNKFSSMPLMMGATREASGDANRTSDLRLNNSRRQIMVVPNCHVTGLQTLPVGPPADALRRVTAVQTNRGTIEVPHNAVVVFALAAIESTRLALLAFPGVAGSAHMGSNLMVHLRTNTQFRVSRNSPLLQGIAWDQLEVSAVQLRGRIDHADGTQGHFHLQVVASGVAAGGGNSDVEIFRKIPDLDQFELFRTTKDDEVAIAIRGIGEFSPMNPNSRVDLDPELDEFGVRRAFVRINDDQRRDKPAIRNLNAKDAQVLQAMVDATNDVLKLFGLPPRPVRSEPPENPAEGIDESVHIKLDGVGTTYHESGTLRMGEDAANSVVNPDLRFHGVANAYVADMSVLPTCGSANPLQPGTALARRLARHLVVPAVPTQGMYLFKDVPTPFWRLAGAPAKAVTFGLGELEVRSAQGPFGLYWCTIPTPPDFELTVEWMTSDPTDNSGVFLRFPDPDRPAPDKSKVFTEPGFIGNEYGFEVQIDNTEGGSSPTNAAGQVTEAVPQRFRGTGAIYNEPRQTLTDVGGLQPGQWHTFVIRARGLSIEVDVRVNGGPLQPRSRFAYDVNAYPMGDVRRNVHRGKPTSADLKRYIGLQTHAQSKLVKFRNIFIRPL